MPRVSVIIPTYNCRAYLPQAIESVLGQTYQDFTLIVVDDGSTDGTREALAPYGERIIYHYQANQGESVARNVGISLASSEYVAFLDADDWWEPFNLERQVNAMDAQPEAVLSYGYIQMVDGDGQAIAFRGNHLAGDGDAGCFAAFPRLVLSNCIAGINTVVIRRSYLKDDALFDPAIQWGEDWDLWLRLALAGPFLFIPEALATYRMRKPGRRLRIEASDEFVGQNEAILRKVFDMVPPDRPDWAALCPRAFSTLYVRSAIYNFELTDVWRGAHYLASAARSDPDFLEQGRAFAERIAAEGFRIGTEKGNWRDGIAFVELIYRHLPFEARELGHYLPYARSRLHAASAFTAFGQGNRPATRRHVVAAIRNDLPSARNLGLLSIGLQAVIGGKPWARRGGPQEGLH